MLADDWQAIWSVRFFHCETALRAK